MDVVSDIVFYRFTVDMPSLWESLSVPSGIFFGPQVDAKSLVQHITIRKAFFPEPDVFLWCLMLFTQHGASKHLKVAPRWLRDHLHRFFLLKVMRAKGSRFVDPGSVGGNLGGFGVSAPTQHGTRSLPRTAFPWSVPLILRGAYVAPLSGAC